MSLMANVTGDKDSVAQTKLENQRRRNPDTAPVEEVAKVTSTSSANNNKAKLRKDKKKDRGKALVRPSPPSLKPSASSIFT